MCEVLFTVRDSTSDDPYLDVKRYKRGDVITVCPDGWAWSQQELTAARWRIVSLPNVSVSQAEDFLLPETPVDQLNPGRMIQRRAKKLDLSHVTIPVGVKTWFQDDTRVQPIRTISMTPAQFLALKVVKPAIPDPNIF